MEEELIAPCGMNCAICSGYLAAENEVKNRDIRISYCAGCRPRIIHKGKRLPVQDFRKYLEQPKDI